MAWVRANYHDPAQLAKILQGVDTVLSFIVAHSDPGSVAQKNLIDAAVQAGVRRFAPSEWTGWATTSSLLFRSLVLVLADLNLFPQTQLRIHAMVRRQGRNPRVSPETQREQEGRFLYLISSPVN